MSCFFDAITAALSDDDLALLNCSRNPIDVIKSLQKMNRATSNVTWQGSRLSTQNISENHLHIKDYDASTFRSGYLTSSADPFMLLCCELFRWRIEFFYCGTNIIMGHVNPIRTVRFHATRRHISISR